MGHHIWPVGQAVKTPPFHGGIASSILARVTSKTDSEFSESVFLRIPLFRGNQPTFDGRAKP